MPRGGKRPGAGRPPGSANLKTREIANKAAAEGLTPLEYMLAVMRDEGAETARRDEMARSAAPYIHPKLTSTSVSGDRTNPVSVAVEAPIDTRPALAEFLKEWKDNHPEAYKSSVRAG